jgi:hypothetical protein
METPTERRIECRHPVEETPGAGIQDGCPVALVVLGIPVVALHDAAHGGEAIWIGQLAAAGGTRFRCYFGRPTRR